MEAAIQSPPVLTEQSMSKRNDDPGNYAPIR